MGNYQFYNNRAPTMKPVDEVLPMDAARWTPEGGFLGRPGVSASGMPPTESDVRFGVSRKALWNKHRFFAGRPMPQGYGQEG